jgi:NADH-quinone oxidoreductase subunit I/electron transport complex protein RnfC
MSIELERGSAYVVDRGRPNAGAGGGLLAGMGVVWRHFRDALTKKLQDPSDISGVFTVQYPEEREQLPEAFRNFPVLLFDDASGQELCTSCFQCERICPPLVIHMTQAKDPATGKPVPAIEEFLLEYDACMSCGLCAEVCPFDAIKMDHEFELSTEVHGGLTIDRAGLARPISYYARLAPTFWAEVRDGALKKLEGTVKRRSGLIGIAPPVAAKLQRAPAALDPPAIHAANAALLNAADTGAPTPASPAAPAPDGEQPRPAPPDKAARLAAIRAANAGKTPAIANDQAAPAVATQAADSDDKAARLAAIRVANAARKAQPTNQERTPQANDIPHNDTDNPADKAG